MRGGVAHRTGPGLWRAPLSRWDGGAAAARHRAPRLPYRPGPSGRLLPAASPCREVQRLWLVCYGNGNLALDWVQQLAAVDDPAAGWLVTDYPSFGLSEGRSTPGRILDASLAAVEALRLRLGWSPAMLAQRLGVLGHSLGTAAALQFAAAQPVQRIVLIAPFATLADMRDLLYGRPCGWLLVHRFDNSARLAEIARQEPRPALVIALGGRDDCVPPAMSARLVADHAGWITRTVIPAADHDSIVEPALRLIAPWIRAVGAGRSP